MSQKPRVILGLDLSLSGTGATVLDHKGKVIHQELIGSKKENTKKNKDKTRLYVKNLAGDTTLEEFIDSSILTDMPRLSFYRNRIKYLILTYQVTEVILEGYSMNSTGQGVTGLAELGGIIRMMIFDLGIPYVQCPPFNAKAYISGISVAEKEVIINAINEKYNILIDDDNIADSFVMAHMLLEFSMDHILEYLQFGGVDKLKARKGEEFREQMTKSSVASESFKKLLNIGQVQIDDVKLLLQKDFSMNIDQLVSSLNLDKKSVEKVFADKKPTTKLLNETYRYKKPKKAKKP